METININDFAKEVHQNAVDHGWWEGDRCLEEILALIHSEWSEALEEYRAGRPLIWHKCPYNSGMCEFQDVHNMDTASVCDACSSKSRKPEGVAVELIDGCIRILDYMGWRGNQMELKNGYSYLPVKKFPLVVSALHLQTARSRDYEACLMNALEIAFSWVLGNGLDPYKIMLEKHEYNKTRPYKHGGKVC